MDTARDHTRRSVSKERGRASFPASVESPPVFETAARLRGPVVKGSPCGRWCGSASMASRPTGAWRHRGCEGLDRGWFWSEKKTSPPSQTSQTGFFRTPYREGSGRHAPTQRRGDRDRDQKKLVPKKNGPLSKSTPHKHQRSTPGPQFNITNRPHGMGGDVHCVGVGAPPPGCATEPSRSRGWGRTIPGSELGASNRWVGFGALVMGSGGKWVGSGDDEVRGVGWGCAHDCQGMARPQRMVAWTPSGTSSSPTWAPRVHVLLPCTGRGSRWGFGARAS